MHGHTLLHSELELAVQKLILDEPFHGADVEKTAAVGVAADGGTPVVGIDVDAVMVMVDAVVADTGEADSDAAVVVAVQHGEQHVQELEQYPSMAVQVQWGSVL